MHEIARVRACVRAWERKVDELGLIEASVMNVYDRKRHSFCCVLYNMVPVFWCFNWAD